MKSPSMVHLHSIFTTLLYNAQIVLPQTPYTINTAATAIPANPHPAFPVIAGTPAVLIAVPEGIVLAAPDSVEVAVLVPVLLVAADVVAANVSTVVKGAAELGELPLLPNASPALIITGIPKLVPL
jgi:hypothetical protein